MQAIIFIRQNSCFIGRLFKRWKYILQSLIKNWLIIQENLVLLAEKQPNSVMYQFICYIKLILILTSLRLIFFPKFPFPKSFCYFIFAFRYCPQSFSCPYWNNLKSHFRTKVPFFFFHLSKKFISILVTFFYQNMHYTFPTYDNVSLIISGSINYKY